MEMLYLCTGLLIELLLPIFSIELDVRLKIAIEISLNIKGK